MTWNELFEAAEEPGVSLDAIRDALERRRGS